MKQQKPPQALGRGSDWRAAAVAAAVIAAASLTGGRYGAAVEPPREAWLEAEQARVERALEIISERSAGFDAEAAIFRSAIPRMLGTLDPHSVFFEPARFDRLREENQVRYGGVGVQVSLFRGEAVIDYPFPGTPAYEAGIRPGDTLEEVDGAPIKGSSESEIEGRIRGHLGTTVRLRLRRGDDDREVDLVRVPIPRRSVPLAAFLRPGVGYIRIATFGEQTADEVDQALEALESEGLEGLVLDLRGNPGGLVSAAVRVAGRLLPPGSTVFWRRGRGDRIKRYRAPYAAHRPYPLTVVTDCSSASAAEIVAGAVQDHDRGLIVGETTFGKGLVQRVFELSAGTGVMLTTARYYTPSGRLIQRSYDGLERADYFAGPCSGRYKPRPTDEKRTAHGRTFYGGGGITPDIAAPHDQPGRHGRRLLRVRAFDLYAQALADRLEELPSDWDATPETLADFERFVSEQGWLGKGPLAARPDFLRRKIRRSVYTMFWNVDEGLRADAELDPQVIAAIAALPRAAQLLAADPSERPSAF